MDSSRAVGWREPSAPYNNSLALCSGTSEKQNIKNAYSKSTSTPGASTVDLLQVGQLGKGMLVAQGNVDESVVSEGAHGGDGSRLLATTESTGGNEKTGVLAPVTTSGPDGASGIPEGLPLSREVTVTSRDTEQNGIVLQKVVGLANGVAGLGRGVHLGQNLLGESLADSRKRLISGQQKEIVLVRLLHTGRCRPCHRRPQYPSAQPRPASGYGHRGSTVRRCGQ